MAEIRIESEDEDGGWSFRVDVIEGQDDRSQHRVTLSEEDHARLAGDDVPPADLVVESFRFLLEREPKESILRTFDLPIIARYFPEYEDEIGTRMDQRAG